MLRAMFNLHSRERNFILYLWLAFFKISLFASTSIESMLSASMEAAETTNSPPLSLSLGGLFNAYGVTNVAPGIYKDEIACQHVAAFVMAVDEINNKNDGILDGLFNGITINTSVVLGQRFYRIYPPNPYFDGASSVFELITGAPDLVGTVETSSYLPQAMASADTTNAFGLLSMLTTVRSSVLKTSASSFNILQISPSIYEEALFLKKLITSKKYRWANICTITGSDIDIVQSYSLFVSDPSIKLIGDFHVDSDETDYSDIIQMAKGTGAQIFIIFLRSGTAGRLLEQGYDAGLFRDGTQVLTTSIVDVSVMTQAFTAAGQLNEAMIMKGFLTTAPHPVYHLNTPAGQNFITRFRALPPTITRNSTTGKEICNNRMDGTGNSFLYAASTAAETLCLGFESFSSFSQNGSGIDPYILFTYDAVHTYAAAYAALVMNNYSSKASTQVQAQALFNTMVAKNFLSYATENVSFSAKTNSRDVGNVFKLLNYQGLAHTNAYSAEALSFVGEHTDMQGWLLCGDQVDMNLMPPMSQALCVSPIYRTADGTRPKDTPPDIVLQSAIEARISLIVLASFGVFVLAVFAVCLFVYRKTKQIKKSQPTIVSFFLVGGFLGLIKVYLAAFELTHSNCVAQMWLSHFAFRFIYRTLSLKLWRVHAVMNAGSFKKVIITESTVLYYLLSDVLTMTIALLIPITIVSSLRLGLLGYVSNTRDNQTYLHAECQVSPDVVVLILNAVLYFSDAVNVILGLYYVYLTRAVPASVNETATLGPAMLGTTVIVIVVAGVTALIPLTTTARSLIINLAFLLVIIGGCGIYFGTKIKEIYEEIKKNSGIKRKHSSTYAVSGEGTKKSSLQVGFMEMSLGHSWNRDEERGSTKGHLHDELNQMIAMVKKERTAEAKLKVCNDQISEWKSMLMLISDNLISSSGSSASHGYIIHDESIGEDKKLNDEEVKI